DRKRVWTCTGFEGFWPVGTAAVVVADSAEEAAVLLTEQVTPIKRQTVLPEDLREVDLTQPQAIVLNNGDY
ncbi:MAG: hypothetical protein ACRCYS_16560, partial [Beijerinckiaceae bacterium]